MNIKLPELFDVVWIDDQHEFTAAEFLALSGLSALEMQHLMECGALQYQPGNGLAEDASEAHARFSGKCLTITHVASRLRRDFELDANGLALTLRLLHRIHELEANLMHLRAQWPGGSR